MKQVQFVVPVKRQASLCSFKEKEALLDQLVDQLKPFIKPDENVADLREVIALKLDPYVLLQGLQFTEDLLG